VDLLALKDADLFHTVHQWVDGNTSSGLHNDVPEDTRLALGYTHILAVAETPPHSFYDTLEAEMKVPVRWLAPSPHLLRTYITAMDVQQFNQHVITLAFQSLHTTYPEWYEGMTFNAHLANYLRQMNR
jgi:hypothetical protein